MTLTRRVLLAGTAAAALAPRTGRAAAAAVPPGVYTRSFDSARTGHWPHETVLTQANVKARGLVLTRTLPLYGDARGTEGQPLIVPQVKRADRSVHDILITATMADYVQGFDVESGAELWRVHVGQAITNTRAYDEWLINQHWGILSTGVINPATGVYYCVAFISPTSSFADAQYFLLALHPADGSTYAAPLNLNVATYQPPGLPVQKFTTAVRKQRAGLAMSADGSTVCVCTGSFLESNSSNRGFVIACNVATNAMSIAACFTTTVTGSGAGIWMASEAPAIDANGDLYVVTANGDFSPPTEWGESLLKLRYTKATAQAAASITVVDHSTPYTDTGRVGGEADQALSTLDAIPNAKAMRDAADPAPTNGMHGMMVHNSAPAPVNMLSAGDEDLGSAGVLYVAAAASGLPYNLAVFGGKDGVIYVADANGMNGASLADFAPATIQDKVYAEFLAAPVWGSYFNPATPTPTDLSTLDTVYAGRTHHIHAQARFYRSPVLGPCLWLMGENGNLRVFRLGTTGTKVTLTYLGCSAVYASPNAPVVPGQSYGGMPGGFLSISSNANASGTGLVHVLYPLGDANKTVTGGVYAVFDADNLGRFADGSGEVQKLWSSADWAIQFAFDKFDVPTIWNGSVLFASYDGCVRQFNLTPA
nr:hypothetical protein [uncultured Lichenicoccus sp.]